MLALGLSLTAHALALYLVPGPRPMPSKLVDVLKVEFAPAPTSRVEEEAPKPPRLPAVEEPQPKPASKTPPGPRPRPSSREPVAHLNPPSPPSGTVPKPALRPSEGEPPPAPPARPPEPARPGSAALAEAAPAEETTPTPPAALAPAELQAQRRDVDTLRGFERRLSALAAEYRHYPRIARLRGWQGTTLILVRIGPQGLVQEVKVAETSGYEVLDRQALEMVRKALSRQPPPPDLRQWYEVTVPIQFRLEERG